MKLTFATFMLCLFASSFPGLALEPLSFQEKWAISSKKSTLLKELSPNTDEYYYYHAVSQLQHEEVDKLTTLLAEWQRAKTTNQTLRQKRHSIQLQYLALIAQRPQHPRHSDALRQLNITIDHPTPIHPTDTSIPSTLDASLISSQHLTETWSLLQRIQNTPANRLNLLLQDPLTPQELQAILTTINTPNHPQLVSFIHRDLQQAHITFGTHNIHTLLTTKQLNQLAELDPKLRQNSQWVSTILQRIQPTTDEYKQWSHDEQRKQAHSLHAFTQTLPPSFSQLQRNALFQKLRFDLANNEAEITDYIDYLKISPAFTRTQRSQDLTSKIQWDSFHRPDSTKKSSTLYQDDLAEYFLSKESNAQALRPYFKDTEFTRLQARAQLLSGNTQAIWKQNLTPEELEQLQQARLLQIRETTPTHWKANDTPFLDLQLKNTPSVIISTYRLDLRSYIQHNRSLPDLSLETASLTPHKQETVSFEKNPFEQFQHRLTFPELASHGDWLIKIEANGLSSAALIHKGDIHTLSTLTPNGYLFHFLDEAHQPIPQLEVRLGKQTLIAHQGELLIPFSPYPTEQTFILSRIRKDGSAGRTSFHTLENTPAEYDLSIGVLNHKELLCADQKATIYAQPQLKIGDSHCPLNTLTSPTLELIATLHTGETLSLFRSHSKLTTNELIPIDFIVPEQLSSLTLSISAGMPDLTQSAQRKKASITVPHSGLPSTVGHIHSQYQQNQQVLYALGKNGEPLSQLPLQITLDHRHYQGLQTSIQLKTDQQGRVSLGDLKDFYSFIVSGTALTPSFYLLLDDHTVKLPKQIYFKKGEHIELICSAHPDADTQFQLYQSNKQHRYLQEISDSLTISKTGQHLSLQLNNLDTGIYTLLSNQGDHCRVSIMEQNVAETPWMTDRYTAQTVSHKKQPKILSTKLTNDSLHIQLDAATPNTRIHIIASHFIDGQATDHLAQSPTSTKETITLAPSRSDWNNGGFLSSEQQYIQNRRLEGNRLGTMLPSPSLLLQPWEIDLSSATAHSQTKKTGIQPRQINTKPSSLWEGEADPFAIGPNWNSHDYSFLQNPAQILANLKPDPTGQLSLPLQPWQNFSNFEVILTDLDHIDSQIAAKPHQSIAMKDQRFHSQLDQDSHFIPRQEITILSKDKPIELNSRLQQQWTAFTSRPDITHYLSSHTDQHERMRLASYFHQWNILSEPAKLRILSEEGCHELHLFLKLHHTPWFEDNVRPILEQKRQRSLLDFFLLDGDLSEYLTPWRFQQLNAVEKALLAHSIPRAKTNIIRVLEHEAEQYLAEEHHLSSYFSSLIHFTPENHTELSEQALKISQLLNETIIDEIRISDPLSLQETLHSLSDSIGYPIQISAEHGSLEHFSLTLDHVSALTLLEHIAEETGLNISITENSIQLLSRSELLSGQLRIRTFRPRADLLNLFAGSSTQTKSNQSAQELLEESGISFPTGSYARWDSQTRTLTVKNSEENLNLIQLILNSRHRETDRSSASDSFSHRDEGTNSTKSKKRPSPRAPRSSKATLSNTFSMQGIEEAHTNSNTKQWAESYYYRSSWNKKLTIRSNKFWIDVAKADSLQSFLSTHFYLCHNIENEALLAIALLDLPSTKQDIQTSQSDGQIRLSSEKPCMIVFEDMIKTERNEEGPVAATVQFFLTEGTNRDTFASTKQAPTEVSDLFQISQNYTMSIKVSNLGDHSKRVNLFASLPNGSIPTSSALTHNNTILLPPYGNYQTKVDFYFPEVGEYTIYPLQISEQGKLLSSLKPKTLRVVKSIPPTDNTSWNKLASYGTSQQVLQYLAENPLTPKQLHLIAWRMRDKDFYAEASKLLRETLTHSNSLLAYSFLHNDSEGQIEWLQTYFSTATPEPTAFPESVSLFSLHQHQPLEWSPLIIERSHELEHETRLNHPSAKIYYQTLLSHLSWKKEPNAEDLLDIIYFLYLQDRPGEATKLLQQINPPSTHCQTQLNYLKCYDAFLQEDIAKATGIAKKALQGSLTSKWQQYFQTVLKQAEQIQSQSLQPIEHLSEDDTVEQTIRLTSIGHDIHLQHGDTEATTLHVYNIDLEVLFSNDPFYDKELGGYQAIEPSHKLKVPLSQTSNKTLYTLPKYLHSENLLITLPSGSTGAEKVVIDSSTINARVSAKKGILQAIQPDKNKFLPRTYVKVYAKLHSENITFFKDGYTDLRGKFRYNTSNRIKLSDIKEFAILIHQPELGGKRILIKN